MAIAFDAGAKTTGTGSSLTFAHTCSGSDRFLYVFTRFYQGDHVTSVTYNSVSMTLINKRQDNSSNDAYTYDYYLIAPSTGSNNVVITADASPSVSFHGLSGSYTGAHQTTPIDSNNSQSSTASTMTISTTVVASNCWLVGGSSNFRTTSAGSGTTFRQQNVGDDTTLADSNGTVGTGSQSLQYTQVDATTSAQHIISLAPAAAAGATAYAQNNLLMLGVS